jgi:hypothetical protein
MNLEAVGGVAGVEHEYRIFRRGALVDARLELDLIGVGRRLDPADPHAQRTPTGVVITADGAEFEVATPPIAVEPGFTTLVEAYSGHGRSILLEALGSETSIEGYSTHINLSVPDDAVVAVARLLVRRFGPALMLVIDAQTSPGIFVRPRHGRLEIGGEFAEGPHLTAGLVLALGATRACAAVVAGTAHRRLLPPPVRCRPVRTIERFGWYLDRGCFGVDLYAAGRDAALRYRNGARSTAAIHLSRSWEVARPFVAGIVSASEISTTEQLVTEPLPRAEVAAPRLRAWGTPPDSVHGRVVRPIVRPAFVGNAVAATWLGCSFEFTDSTASVYATVAASDLESFVDDLAAGVHDGRITEALRSCRLSEDVISS